MWRLGLILSALLLAGQRAAAADDDILAKGKYLYAAADCAGCHGGSNGGAPAGGKSLATPFGVFLVPNISSDPDQGIGGWTPEEFRRALRRGIAPGGIQLFPVFPFPSFTGLTDQDIDAIRAYLLSLPAAPDQDRPHRLKAPFGYRPLMALWRLFFLKTGPYVPDPAQSPDWNRGNYLVHAVAHCEECHTPRNLFGALDESRAFSGNIGGPDGQNAPNISSDRQTGIGSWTAEEIAHLLKSGETPDFDQVASGMAEVVRGTRHLTDADRMAIALYLKSVKAIHSERKPPPRPPS